MTREERIEYLNEALDLLNQVEQAINNAEVDMYHGNLDSLGIDIEAKLEEVENGMHDDDEEEEDDQA